MLPWVLAAVLALGTFSPAHAAPQRVTELHVAPDGTGSLCSSAEPCALDTAQAKVRAATPRMDRDIVVDLHGGTYRRTSTWELSAGAGDSGRNGHRVIYQAAGYGTQAQEQPVLSGGRTVTGWDRTDDPGVWRAPVGDLRTR